MTHLPPLDRAVQLLYAHTHLEICRRGGSDGGAAVGGKPVHRRAFVCRKDGRAHPPPPNGQDILYVDALLQGSSSLRMPGAWAGSRTASRLDGVSVVYDEQCAYVCTHEGNAGVVGPWSAPNLDEVTSKQEQPKSRVFCLYMWGWLGMM